MWIKIGKQLINTDFCQKVLLEPQDRYDDNHAAVPVVSLILDGGVVNAYGDQALWLRHMAAQLLEAETSDGLDYAKLRAHWVWNFLQQLDFMERRCNHQADVDACVTTHYVETFGGSVAAAKSFIRACVESWEQAPEDDAKKGSPENGHVLNSENAPIDGLK